MAADPYGRFRGGSRPPAGERGRPPRPLDEPEAPNQFARELRMYGLNAVRAVFARRPEAIRKLYLSEARIAVLQPLLKWCAANRVGYRVVEEEDLRKLAASSHHEGVVADILREPPQALVDSSAERRGGKECVRTWRSR